MIPPRVQSTFRVDKSTRGFLHKSTLNVDSHVLDLFHISKHKIQKCIHQMVADAFIGVYILGQIFGTVITLTGGALVATSVVLYVCAATLHAKVALAILIGISATAVLLCGVAICRVGLELTGLFDGMNV